MILHCARNLQSALFAFSEYAYPHMPSDLFVRAVDEGNQGLMDLFTLAEQLAEGNDNDE